MLLVCGLGSMAETSFYKSGVTRVVTTRSHTEVTAMDTIITLTDRVTIAVGLSKFKTPSVELRRNKYAGGLKKAFLTPATLSLLYERCNEVSALVKLMTQGLESGESPTSIPIPLTDKRSILIDAFNNRVWVNIQTLKDGVNQPGLAFGFDGNEWCEFVKHQEEVKSAVTAVADAWGSGGRGGGTGPDDPRVQQYRPLLFQPRGDVRQSGVWYFTDGEARAEAATWATTSGSTVRVQSRWIPRPKLSAIRDIATCTLMYRHMKRESRNIVPCSGCEENQGNQMAHTCVEDRIEDLYDSALVGVNVYHTAALVHELLHHMGLDRGTAQNVAPPTNGDEERLKKVVLDLYEEPLYVDAHDSIDDCECLYRLACYILDSQAEQQ